MQHRGWSQVLIQLEIVNVGIVVPRGAHTG